MQLAGLRLVGFKSFVERTELTIASGLTGIVGPNGCGKSNLVEALRWAMGESSARQLRGGEMDDVIFGGTALRPARNIAEVALRLDNSAHGLPGPFNDQDEIEVVRRIERGAGSTYRVQGREVRARDVQMLFADAATGAHSAALISQGRVGTLITAKPADRKALLETAAGIGGLHARRHEAELKLRGAETNLERLEDVLRTLEEQLHGLRRQARQAARYRTITDQIRRTEALLILARWRALGSRRRDAARDSAEMEGEVGRRSAAATEAAALETEIAAALPALRDREAEAGAVRQRLLLAGEALDAEAARVAAATAELDRRLAELMRDRAREESRTADAAGALARLGTERERLDAASAGEGEAERRAAAQFEAGQQAVARLDAEVSGLTAAVAADAAERAARQRQLEERRQRHARLARDAAMAAAELGRRRQAAAAADELDAVRAAAAAADAAVADGRGEAEAAEAARAAAEDALQSARADAQRLDSEEARRAAEANGLKALLRSSRPREAAGRGEPPPALDSVEVEPGFEAALGAALGDDLSAPVVDIPDSAVARRRAAWCRLPGEADGGPGWPAGIEPLAAHVTAPPALARRLSRIGIAADPAAAAALQPALAPGQRLVTRKGGLWRWDGFIQPAGAETTAALHLTQRNRLAALEAAEHALAPALAAARSTATQAAAAATAAMTADKAARTALARAFQAQSAAREALARKLAAAAAEANRLGAAEETAARLEREAGEAASALAESEAVWAAQPAADAAQARLTALRTELAAARSRETETRAALDRLRREAAGRRRRRADIAQEMQAWQERAAVAAEQDGALAGRHQAATEERRHLAERPAALAQERTRVATAGQEAEAAFRAAESARREAESRAAGAQQARREAETALAAAREERIRREAALGQINGALAELVGRAQEKLQRHPDALPALLELDPDGVLDEPSVLEQRLQRLIRERDGMGPVNLRAEAEADEVAGRIETMIRERDDLVAAIGRLRQAIGTLNREARERLNAAFEAVNGHFQDLFARLFGGGRALLTLTGSDDPLSAGLEIMASPPGKRLQTLSLLSGGEQALTALALVFAVFLTKPAPICVLDEVDAPLDDANVDRMCNLLGELAAGGATRFLVITHHRLTMARMHRLYGVTMAERGVSQLVSVDLEGAERLRATA